MVAVPIERLPEDPAFDREGHWRAGGTGTGPIDEPTFRREFAGLVAHLPDLQARAFTLREVEGLAPARICTRMGIGPDRLEQLLFEARLAMCRALAGDATGR